FRSLRVILACSGQPPFIRMMFLSGQCAATNEPRLISGTKIMSFCGMAETTFTAQEEVTQTSLTAFSSAVVFTYAATAAPGNFSFSERMSFRSEERRVGKESSCRL